MFADRALAARIDRAEAALLRHGVCSALRNQDGSLHPRSLPVAGGYALYVSPSSPVNKVIGIGFDGPLEMGSLEAVEDEWRALEEPVRVELSILAHETVAPALAARGYQVHGFENVLGRPIGPPEPWPAAPGITVERLSETDERLWLQIAVDAFSNLDGTGSAADDSVSREALERAMEEFAAAPGFARYLARADGRPVGIASLSITDGVAQIAGAGTLPAFRGRGIQKALLHRRLADALAEGCELAVVTTAPGTRSQENVMKRGFELLYTRAVLIRRWA